MENNSDYKIEIVAMVKYIEDQSNEADNRYVFSYSITISNNGDSTVQLLSRHWVITDANNQVQEVRGQGVVGEQPVIKPGQGFGYTSGTVLSTPVGTMTGSYQMVTEDGKKFEVTIPQFVLSVPRVLH
ncbi:MAG: Co2+/Mg2+ efflux protein ApaG [Gallionellaceae bacterium]